MCGSVIEWLVSRKTCCYSHGRRLYYTFEIYSNESRFISFAKKAAHSNRQSWCVAFRLPRNAIGLCVSFRSTEFRCDPSFVADAFWSAFDKNFVHHICASNFLILDSEVTTWKKGSANGTPRNSRNVAKSGQKSQCSIWIFSPIYKYLSETNLSCCLLQMNPKRNCSTKLLAKSCSEKANECANENPCRLDMWHLDAFFIRLRDEVKLRKC